MNQLHCLVSKNAISDGEQIVNGKKRKERKRRTGKDCKLKWKK